MTKVKSSDNEVKELIESISNDTKRVIKRVIDLENENLHMKQPQILDDIEKIVREEVK